MIFNCLSKLIDWVIEPSERKQMGKIIIGKGLDVFAIFSQLVSTSFEARGTYGLNPVDCFWVTVGMAL